MNWEEERTYARAKVEYLQEDPVKYNVQFALEVARAWEAALINPRPNYAELRAVVEKARTQPNAFVGKSMAIHFFFTHMEDVLRRLGRESFGMD